MSQQSIDTALNSWHKYFAIESNNQTWQLLEHQQRTEAESLKMLDLAHTATFHWNAIGTMLHKMRKMLLAEVYAHAACVAGQNMSYSELYSNTQTLKSG